MPRLFCSPWVSNGILPSVNALLVAIGGALGALTRYWVGTQAQELGQQLNFPLGTLCVNLIGCFLIGLYMGFHRKGLPDYTRLLLVVGFLGGFTTFSSFGFETFELIKGADYAVAALNVGLQCTVGLLLVWAGAALAEALTP